MNRCGIAHSQRGFSLLEAIIAMVVMSMAMLALYGWLSTSILGLTRAQDNASALQDARAALALVDAVNPMDEPEGRRELGGLEVSWRSDIVSPRRPGRSSSSGLPGLFEVALYRLDVEVRRDSRLVRTFSVRKAGWTQVRALGDEE